MSGLGAIGSLGKTAEQAIFNKIDTDHNGHVSKDELVSLQNRLQSKGIKAPFLNTLVQNFDSLNKDGGGLTPNGLAKSALGRVGKAALGFVGGQALNSVGLGGAAQLLTGNGTLNKIEGLVGKGVGQLFASNDLVKSALNLKA